MSDEKKEQSIARIVILKDEEINFEKISFWLSKKELEKYRSFPSEKRKSQFVMGRIAAKQAIMLLDDAAKNPTNISISNSDNGAPAIIKGASCSVSISHSKNCAAAIAFLPDFSFGIDVEYIDGGKIKALSKLTAIDEPVDRTPEMLTIAWCSKEALGKALLCGFNHGFEHLKISFMKKKDKNPHIYACKYANYDNYSSISTIIDEKIVISVAYDSRARLILR